uniref:Pyrin domain-containing protein n=1 Tax=Myripristis murdjan TaxID=586833 RepID=A0A668AM44_9TELE
SCISSYFHLLVNILEDLGDADFRKFQWYLSQPVVNGYKAIPKSRTEKKTREEIVDEMVQSYCEDPAVTVAVEILRKIHHNAAAEMLSRQYAGAG